MDEQKKDYRVEQDSIGTKDVPKSVYYGVQSLRAAENFHITGLNMHPEIINSLAYIKKAAAITNCEVGILDKTIADAIVKACDEILKGKLHDNFIVDPIQGGAGTSLNMNANEVIANRAIEILGGKKGDYSIVNPNDHVNCGQSTNDVIPTAGKMTSLRLLKNLKYELELLYEALCRKSEEFDHVIKMGRTQIYKGLLDQLGLESRFYRGDSKRQLQQEIEVIRGVQHKKVVCILDEAHLLEKETLEEFRFLLNYRFDSMSPMAVVLVGQTELWENKLKLQRYAAIRQRIDMY